MDSEFVEELLKLVAKHDAFDWLIWQSNLSFYVICNDSFSWGAADCEGVTPESLPVLKQAFEDAGIDGPLLYCARMRKMRPQGATYSSIEKEHWSLFDACGPEREIGLGNPYSPQAFWSLTFGAKRSGH